MRRAALLAFFVGAALGALALPPLLAGNQTVGGVDMSTIGTGGAAPFVAWDASAGVAPAGTTSFASLDTRGPASGHVSHCLDFDEAVDEESVYFRARMPEGYGDGTLTVTLDVGFTSSTDTGAQAYFGVAFQRIDAGTLDLDANSFASAKWVAVAPNGTSGVLTQATLTFSQAEADGVSAGDLFVIKVTRDGAGETGTDDAAGDAELYGVSIYE